MVGIGFLRKRGMWKIHFMHGTRVPTGGDPRRQRDGAARSNAIGRRGVRPPTPVPVASRLAGTRGHISTARKRSRVLRRDRQAIWRSGRKSRCGNVALLAFLNWGGDKNQLALLD